MKSLFPRFFAPVFTPFKHDTEKSLDLEQIPPYATFLKQRKIKGILVNGTSGEGPSQSLSERKLVAETWMTNVGKDMHVMVQVGGAPLPDVIELAKHAEQIGAHSLLCLPDLYFKPQTIEDLILYLAQVSKAAPNTPLLYYHIPMFSNVSIHMGKFLNKIGDRIPKFAGIKFTSNDLSEGMEAVNAQEGKFSVFLGADTILLGAFALGFDSVIATTYNFFSDAHQELYDTCKLGNIAHARNLQEGIVLVVNVALTYGPWVYVMKRAMELITKLKMGPTRSYYLSQVVFPPSADETLLSTFNKLKL